MPGHGCCAMQLEEIKKRTNPLNRYNLAVLLMMFVLATWSWKSTEMSVGVLAKGWLNMIVYLTGNPEIENSGFFPPASSSTGIVKYVKLMVETVQMAFLALILSVAISFPLAFFASRNTLEIIFPGQRLFDRVIRKVSYITTRFVANLARSINELVWSLMFVSAVGLGPMPGILALGVHTGGVLIKLFSEGIENIQSEPVTALTATGAGPLKVIRYAVIPQISPFFVSMLLYRFESDVRSATILGFTGAGGIGVYLYDKLRSYENRDVTTMLIIIIITVAIVDRMSAWIRKKYT